MGWVDEGRGEGCGCCSENIIFILYRATGPGARLAWAIYIRVHEYPHKSKRLNVPVPIGIDKLSQFIRRSLIVSIVLTYLLLLG